ncbi:MAG: SpoIIE family protein phosphatase [Oscillospiraceae bacterium]|nr:SpoIIE family protein phosphatase [Oscillospiraceae bacterium]
MKESQKTAPSLPLRARRLRRVLAAQPMLRAAAQSAGYLLLGLLLSGGSVAGQALPFGACLIAAAATSLQALAAAAGCVAGYLGGWGVGGGLEYAAVSVLVFAAVCIVGDAGMTGTGWFRAALTAAMGMLVGILFLLQARFAPGAVAWYAARLAASVVGVRLFRAALEERSPGAVVFLAACLLSGCAAAPLVGGVTLGQVLAVAAAVAAAPSPRGMVWCAAAGLAVDIAVVPPVSLTALLCFSGLVSAWPRLRHQAVRILLFLVAFSGGVLFTGGLMPELVPAAALGCCLSLAIPTRLFAVPASAQRVPAARQRLELAAGLLGEVGGMLAGEGPAAVQTNAAVIFDRAAEKACAPCVLWPQCWQQHSTETYHALCAVAGPMLERGAVVREDFPAAFADKCCHLDGLMIAINRELDALAGRRQMQNRLLESRAILAGQYGCLSGYLRRTARELEAEAPPEPQFAPELGIAAAGKHGQAVSGDKSACLRTADGRYYLLLCDGMGTGGGAAAESIGAVRLLTGLLRAGLSPREALETLNSVCILRGDGSFATVDLLEASLVTGEATLYKWGSAPSYLRGAEATQKIGTAAPPPGLGVGETHKAAEYQLSLCEGELLVLLSDGAGGEDAGRQITDWADGSPKTLAAALVASAQAEGEDDMTALALRLRPCNVRT